MDESARLTREIGPKPTYHRAELVNQALLLIIHHQGIIDDLI